MQTFQPLPGAQGMPASMTDILPFTIMNRFMTGNPFVDPLIHMFVYTLVGILVANLKDILSFSWLSYYLGKLLGLGKYYFFRHVWRQDEIIHKQVNVCYVDENKRINHLYKAMDWYLSSQLPDDLIHETPLDLFFEKDLEVVAVERHYSGKHEDSDLKAHASIAQNKYKSLQFEDYEIFYLRSKNLITVYGEQERKKENHCIQLSATIKKSDNRDILQEFCNHCLNAYRDSLRRNEWAQKIYVNNDKGEWTEQKSNNTRKLETVILKDGVLDKIKSDVEIFLKSEQWYQDRDIPYTRGYLFYGKPGTGKTSLIKGLSTFTKRHIHYLMLKNVASDQQLLELLQKINYSSTILILEDVDCVSDIVKSRHSKDKKAESEDLQEIKKQLKKLNKEHRIDNFTKESELTLQGILNALDGVFNNDGRILIMTTNHPEVLDEALIRSRRVDMKVEFDYCDRKQIANIYHMFFDCKCPPKYLKKVPPGLYSPADITSLFLRYHNEPEAAFDHLDEMASITTVSKKLFSEVELASKRENGNHAITFGANMPTPSFTM